MSRPSRAGVAPLHGGLDPSSGGPGGAAVRRADGGVHEATGCESSVGLIDEVTRALGLDASLRERLEQALAALEVGLGVTRSVVYAVDSRARAIEAIACRGLGASRYRPRLGAGVAGRAAQSKQRIVVPEVRLEPMALSELTDREDWADERWSLAALPLLCGKEVVGVLSCYALGGSTPLAASADYSAVAMLLAEALARAQRAAPRADGPDAPQRARQSAGFEYANMVGASPAMRLVYEEIGQVARTNATTLIRGESGTGKELIACAIHGNSDRANFPLIKVNCAALPEPLFESELFGHERGAYTGAHTRRRGRFELAENGTLFLDEIGELSPALQAKLLRVLQAREFERVGGTETLRTNVRIIAATNRNLEACVKSGEFRQDLYYRLNVFSITVPPLRGRRADIWSLAEHFVAKYVAEHRRSVTGISNRALDALSEYTWPGNVRELENAIERAVVVCDGFVIQEQHLPASIRQPSAAPAEAVLKPTLREAVAALETQMLREALTEARGNCARAARELGITERVVRYKAAQYGIDVEGLRTGG
ncbi:MAG TPA: sigma-54-dependent Fis family transcriptional regulator [Polyangiaceae bacterium]|nr:sigma-54-dependent Fis family transcriptional regulator [Polyangiaceae bacterium]